MTEVGIRGLKADLSGYLKRAAAGEQGRVTMRGGPFVDLVPASRAPQTAADTIALLDQLADAGILTRPIDPDAPRLPSRTYKLTGSPVDDIIAERDRERLR